MPVNKTARRLHKATPCLLFGLVVGIFVVQESAISSAHPHMESKVKLGRALFFDKRLSEDHTVSCATCHDPASAFAAKDVAGIGVRRQRGTRNAPTLLNSVFSKSYFWDGRAATLEEQAKQPLLNPSEMGMESEAELVRRVNSLDEYRQRFRQVFPREGITLNTIANAIAAFERTLVSGDSPFDRFITGDVNALNENQRNGWRLFKGKAKCIECHTFSTASPHFTDFKFYNTGVGARAGSLSDLAERARKIKLSDACLDPAALAHDPVLSDLGRFLITGDANDIGAFKTPSLREVELTGPYMHDGSLRTILDVIRFYNAGGVQNPYLDKKMQPLHLSDAEMSQLAEFLRALTSDDVLRTVQTTIPQSRNPVQLP